MRGFAFMALVNNRRSLRRYDPARGVSDDSIRAVLEAARLAPSAENSQPWRFVVVRDPGVREALSRECFAGIYRPTRFAAKAPVIIALCADRTGLLLRAGEIFLHTAFYQLDCGIAGEHLVLAAAALGLGTCWIGWFNKKKAKKVLRIPAGLEMVALIAAGYPPKDLRAKQKVRKPFSAVAFLDAWGKPFPGPEIRTGGRKS
jgi:nitroreductase